MIVAFTGHRPDKLGGYAPCAILMTTTTLKLYTNTGTALSATWTIVGSQS